MSKVGNSLLRGAQEALSFAQNDQQKGFKTHDVKIPDSIDVKAIRHQLDMDRQTFAKHFGFKLRTLEKWEQGIRQPESPTRAYLKVISCNPQAVERALWQ